MKNYILALDQGTTSSRSILFDKESNIIASANKEFKQIYPQNGWVEHDPEEIWKSQYDTILDVMKKSGAKFTEIAGIGITNHRETTVVWDKDGKPIHNAIVWQCRRTADYCDKLKKDGWSNKIQDKTGLLIDAYFSATKLKWILENCKYSNINNLKFGTIDTWLINKLTNGKVHATDYSNASRTMMYNIKELTWDKEILNKMNIPTDILPKVKNSSEIFGYTEPNLFDGNKIPICGVAGDQQAALFGQNCFSEGSAKNTYGTGCFLLMNTGSNLIHSKNNLLTTIAWGIDGKIEYALEGSVFIAGAAIQWLRDELGLIKDASETEKIALSIQDNGYVYFVPAFVGLGAPYWDQDARGAIVGLTRGSNKNHIVRAALESMAYQTKDVLDCMEKDSGIPLKSLKVDGGASANNFLMQFQSDILNIEVERPKIIETTALGAAYLAGLAIGFWKDKDEIKKKSQKDRMFKPEMKKQERVKLVKGWKFAVKQITDF